MASGDDTQQKDGFEIPHEKTSGYWEDPAFCQVMVRRLPEGANIFRDPQDRFFITKSDISEAWQIEMCLRFTKKKMAVQKLHFA